MKNKEEAAIIGRGYCAVKLIAKLLFASIAEIGFAWALIGNMRAFMKQSGSYRHL